MKKLSLLSIFLCGCLIFACDQGSSNKKNTTSTGEVADLTATASESGQITLTWTDPTDNNFTNVEITWDNGGTTPQTVEKGVQKFIATGLTNETNYTFTVKTVDSSENISTGITVSKSITVDVYVLGNVFNETNGFIKYWKNGTAVSVTDGTQDAYGSSFFVYNNDIYIAGVEYNGSNYVATYWKNGTAVTLTDGTQDAHASSIFVSGSDVYVAGSEYNGANYVATYWKNGAVVPLTDGTNDARATAIFVSGNDVYVAGDEANGTGGLMRGFVMMNYIATYWKNGTAIHLTDGTKDARATAIFVSGNDVYVAGDEANASSVATRGNLILEMGYIATYWKNGTAVPLTDGTKDAHATSIFVSGNDVYVAGDEANTSGSGGLGRIIRDITYIAKYWKNSTMATLSEQNSRASSIFVSGNDVYAAGTLYTMSLNNAVYWKNNSAINLSTGSTQSESARSIIVIAK